MRPRLTIFLPLALLIAGIICSCRTHIEVKPDPEVMVDTTLVISAAGGTNYLTILSEYGWSASMTVGGDWCTFTPDNGGVGSSTMTISTTENEEPIYRSARIDLTSENGWGIIRIVQQEIAVLDLSVDSSCAFGPDGGTFAVRLDYNVDLDITCDGEWVQSVPTKAYLHDILSFAVEKNLSGEDRSCTVTFSGGRITRTLTVSQQAPYLTLSVNEACVSAAESEFTVTVESNASYDFTPPEYDWVSLANIATISDNGNANATGYTFSVKENEQLLSREAQVMFSCESYGITATLNVLQQAVDVMTADLPAISFEPDGGVFEFDLKPDTEYQISAGEADWITLGASETNPLRRVITVAKNISGNDRNATVVIKTGDQTREIEISQIAASIKATPEKFMFFTDGGSKTLTVEATVPFEVIPDGEATWCTLEQVSTSQFIVGTESNNTEALRSCTILLVNKEYGLSVGVLVEQSQLDVFEISPTSIEMGPEGGPVEIAIHVNVDYKCTCDDDWLTEDESASTPSLRKFVVALNDTRSPRKTRLFFTAESFWDMVSISQECAIITAREHLFEVDQNAHQLMVETESNVPFEVKTTDNSWIIIDEMSDAGIAFSVLDNQDASGRTGEIILYNESYPATDTVKIVQQARGYLDFAQTEFYLSAMANTVTLDLMTNKEYQYAIQGDPDWIREVSPLVFEVDANHTGQERSCTIAFEQDGTQTVISVFQAKAVLTLDAYQLEFPPEGGVGTIKVTKTVDTEVITPIDDWVVIKSNPDSTFTIQVSANPLRRPRECNLVLFNNDFDLRVEATISQEWTEYFEILTPEFQIGPKATNFFVKLNTNMEYTCAPDVDWIEDAGGGVFNVSDNLSGEERVGTVTYTVGEATYTVTVHQEKPFITASPESFAVDSVGGTIAIGITTNIDYTIDLHDTDWIYDSGISDTGEHVFDIVRNRERESRSAQIDFISDLFSIVTTVTIDQSGIPFFDVEKEEYVLGPSECNLTIVHTPCSDVEMTLSDSPWIRELEDLRTDTQLFFELDTNFTDQARVASMALTGNGLTQLVTVMQNPPILELSLDHKSVSADGESVLVEITSNFMPEVSFSADWISGVLGDDGCSLRVDIAENTTGAARSATVTIGCEELRIYKDITFNQAANLILDLSVKEYTIEAEGGSFLVTVTTNVSFSLLSLTQWLTYTATDDPNVFQINVAPNTSTTARSGSLFFRSVGIQTSLTVNQEGRINESYYRSTDFSADGTVTLLQEATEGDGINIILMGDAFSDRLIADGTYTTWMNKAMEAFFAIEPFKTFRNKFNVYALTLVSTNEVIADDSRTALSTYFSSSTNVGGNNETVRNKARSIVGTRIGESLIIVLMNSETYGGTTYMFYDTLSEADYGLGEAIAYIPLCTSEEEFTQVLQHEAGGHGFGKLEDEYAYKSVGPITEDKIATIMGYQTIGYYKNVDFTSNLNTIRWSKFISDQRYKYDGIGAFEGACTYYSGVWRPTEESIMRHNTGGFNAPSREAIYYRIHKLAYGDQWQYNHENFVEYDAINRKTAPQASNTVDMRRVLDEEATDWPVLPHPVMIRQ